MIVGKCCTSCGGVDYSDMDAAVCVPVTVDDSVR